MEQEVPDKKYTMAVNFTNGRLVEIEVSSNGLEKLQEQALKDLENGSIVKMENFIFRMKDVAFVAFLEKQAVVSIASDDATSDKESSQ